ncbi:MAG TPA: LysM peptidoglycan-binding domain-containing protein [Planctomycetes bacterium]|nr:LysM peptidoglycan-binding domain-containing protein [Planctomycetota bacterium]HIN79708.1 LysM peptidoglycan-binding domain-containing protein [Planctomycetota bacterium]
MGTGTKIGMVLALVLAVVLIANLLDREVERAPSAREQITGRIASRGLTPVPEKRTPRIVTESQGAVEPVEFPRRGPEASAQATVPTVKPKPSEVAIAENKNNPPPEKNSPERGENPGQPVPSLARIESSAPISAIGVIDENGDRRSVTPVPASNFSGVPGFPKIHTIVDGDSLWQIADKYYSRGHLYRVILEANPVLGSGELLVVGTTIQIPALSASSVVSQPVARRSVEPGFRQYRIRKGDTLYEIAEEMLGDGLRWQEIQRANPELDSGNLRIGQVIRIPAAK